MGQEICQGWKYDTTLLPYLWTTYYFRKLHPLWLTHCRCDFFSLQPMHLLSLQKQAQDSETQNGTAIFNGLVLGLLTQTSESQLYLLVI